MLQNENIYLFLFMLPIVSFLYASVGHGGASGYLALMALFSFSPEIMKPTALLLNLFVAGISFYYYYKGGYFNKKLFLSFAITSIPLAFLGGTIEIDASVYKKIL
ncbi:MAG TPA: TSUP family transporter, partial [Mariniflexile sp.]